MRRITACPTQKLPTGTASRRSAKALSMISITSMRTTASVPSSRAGLP